MNSVSQTNKCYVCSKSNAKLSCGVCVQALCKSCAEFLDEDHFSFWPQKATNLCHSIYCQSCYSNVVEPALAEYTEIMNRARQILVFMRDQGKETRLIRRIELPVVVEDCADYDETILRLAFMAAEKGKNAIVDTEVKTRKVREGSYQTSRFSGTAIPADVRDDKLIKDRSLWQNPN